MASVKHLEGMQVSQPSQGVIKKVFFICNNLSQTNLVEKTEEVKQLIAANGDDFVKWLAQYLVNERVTLEQNFHQLYNNFLLSVSNSTLDAMVLMETYRTIEILLRSDKRSAASNFGDRQLLNNLGHWLGLITIGRDKAILRKDLDLKALLIEAFYNGQQELLYVVPFVAKVLSASIKSTVFGPDCAWVNGIVKVLVEIHDEPELKLGLKFEVRVLCKELNIDLRSVKVGNYMKDQSRLTAKQNPVQLAQTFTEVPRHHFSNAGLMQPLPVWISRQAQPFLPMPRVLRASANFPNQPPGRSPGPMSRGHREVGRCDCCTPPEPFCRHCYSHGHTGGECPQATCYNCGLMGHIWGTQPPGVACPWAYGICRNCRGGYHRRKDCPKRDRFAYIRRRGVQNYRWQQEEVYRRWRDKRETNVQMRFHPSSIPKPWSCVPIKPVGEQRKSKLLQVSIQPKGESQQIDADLGGSRRGWTNTPIRSRHAPSTSGTDAPTKGSGGLPIT